MKTEHPERNRTETSEPRKRATPDGRMEYDIREVIESPEAQRHFRELDKLADEGKVPKPSR
jgi:hypothetical protein